MEVENNIFEEMKNMNLVDKKLKVYELINKKIRSVFGGMMSDDLFIQLVNEIDKIYTQQDEE